MSNRINILYSKGIVRRILKYLSQSGQPFPSLRFEPKHQPSKPKTKLYRNTIITSPTSQLQPPPPPPTPPKNPPSIIRRTVDINELKCKAWSSIIGS
jgi:hypothetical protein